MPRKKRKNKEAEVVVKDDFPREEPSEEPKGVDDLLADLEDAVPVEPEELTLQDIDEEMTPIADSLDKTIRIDSDVPPEAEPVEQEIPEAPPSEEKDLNAEIASISLDEIDVGESNEIYDFDTLDEERAEAEKTAEEKADNEAFTSDLDDFLHIDDAGAVITSESEATITPETDTSQVVKQEEPEVNTESEPSPEPQVSVSEPSPEPQKAVSEPKVTQADIDYEQERQRIIEEYMAKMEAIKAAPKPEPEHIGLKPAPEPVPQEPVSEKKSKSIEELEAKYNDKINAMDKTLVGQPVASASTSFSSATSAQEADFQSQISEKESIPIEPGIPEVLRQTTQTMQHPSFSKNAPCLARAKASSVTLNIEDVDYSEAILGDELIVAELKQRGGKKYKAITVPKRDTMKVVKCTNAEAETYKLDYMLRRNRLSRADKIRACADISEHPEVVKRLFGTSNIDDVYGASSARYAQLASMNDDLLESKLSLESLEILASLSENEQETLAQIMARNNMDTLTNITAQELIDGERDEENMEKTVELDKRVMEMIDKYCRKNDAKLR